MPPPPLPPRLAVLSPRSPSAIALPNSPILPGPHDSLSPSSRFANLSLLSPVTYGPSSYFSGNTRRVSTSPTPPPPTPSPPVHQDDEAPEEPPPAKEVEMSSTTTSVQDQPPAEPAASSSIETDTHHHSGDAPVEASQSATTNDVPAQSTPEKHDATLPSRPASTVPWDTVPMDVSVDPVEKAGTPDVHDVAMSSPVIPSINVTEESAEPAPEAPAPVEEAVPEPALEKPRTPSPPPRPTTPKVKLSLKDFAARKKKQREEAGKARGRQGSMAPSEAASSLPNTPAGQLATLADSPALVIVSLAPTGEPPSKLAAPAPLEETRSSSAAKLSSQSEVAPNGISATVPSDNSDEPRVEPVHTTAGSIEERLGKARDVPPQDTLELKLEVMEPAVPPETRMVKGRRLASETDSAEDGTTNDSFRPTEPKAVVEAPTGPRTPPRNERLRALSFSAPIDVSPREEFGPKTPPRPRARSPRMDRPLSFDGVHEDGEIVSPPPKTVPLPPRSSSPPTHPRAYYPPPRGPTDFPPGPRRPFRHQTLQNTLPPDRHLPRAPRALREPLYPMLSGRPPPPRGPSADRERTTDWERERDRGWVTSSRGRGRGGGWNR